MPTFREDVKLGTKISLIKTDDISNNAVSEEKLSKAFRRKVEEIGGMTKAEMEDIVKSSELINVGASLKKAKRKKVKQVLIGKAIKPTSVSRSDVENWYAFIDNPCLIVKNTEEFKDNTPDVHLYVRELGLNDYQEEKIPTGSILGTNSFSKIYRILFTPEHHYIMYKVDRYQRDGYSHDIYLTYKLAPLTLKGQSITNEWQNGKRVCKKKISKGRIIKDLQNLLKDSTHLYIPSLEYRRITSRRKTKHIRLLAKRVYGIKSKCRREVSWFTPNAKITKNVLNSGLFKVRQNRNGYKTNWQTIYVRTIIDENRKKILKEVTFK